MEKEGQNKDQPSKDSEQEAGQEKEEEEVSPAAPKKEGEKENNGSAGWEKLEFVDCVQFNLEDGRKSNGQWKTAFNRVGPDKDEEPVQKKKEGSFQTPNPP